MGGWWGGGGGGRAGGRPPPPPLWGLVRPITLLAFITHTHPAPTNPAQTSPVGRRGGVVGGGYACGVRCAGQGRVAVSPLAFRPRMIGGTPYPPFPTHTRSPQSYTHTHIPPTYTSPPPHTHSPPPCLRLHFFINHECNPPPSPRTHSLARCCVSSTRVRRAGTRPTPGCVRPRRRPSRTACWAPAAARCARPSTAPS